MSKPEEFYTPEDEITFNILNPETVRKLEREGDITLPKKKVDVPKDMRWNTKQIASKLYQGILGGDSIPKIAKSLMEVIGNNKASAVRNARTMVTGAENAGRLDSYNDLAEQGVVQKKEWIATPDDRTRESHIAVDGEERDIDKPFSNGLMYPGDPAGDPAEVWNCRCSMGTHIVGFRKADGSVSKVDYTADRTMHEEQMEAEKERRGFEALQKEAEVSKSFILATTIEEAERFANDTFIKGGFNLTGKNISYKGIDIDTANRINERLDDIYSQYDIEKLSSLEAYGKANKKIYASHTDAPFFTTNFGNVGMNSTLLKDSATIEKYAKDGENAFQYVMSNMDKLSGAQLEIAKAYEIAGRSLVDNSLEGMITHEIGHHISYMTGVNSELAKIQNSDWHQYAEHLSGYANHSFGEYVAESFTAYYNGETKGLQPELIEIFKELKK